MKKANILLATLSALMLINCESPVYIDAGVNWSDDSYFSEDGDWYLALSEGCYSNCEGASVTVVDQLPITVNQKVIKKFALGSGSEGNITAFVYLDVNKNGSFDHGYDKITGYKYNYSEKNETTAIAVSAFF